MTDSDEALFERLASGDMAAFDRLYDRFERPLFGMIRAQLGDAGEAEDVLHEAFIAVLRARDARTPMRSFRAWIFSVAHHLCLNRARSRKRAGRAVEAAAHVAVIDADAPAEQALERHELTASLQRAVARLPQVLADVYRLRAAGMSYEEVAEVLAVPVGTVKSRAHAMVKRLREEVQT